MSFECFVLLSYVLATMWVNYSVSTRIRSSDRSATCFEFVYLAKGKSWVRNGVNSRIYDQLIRDAMTNNFNLNIVFLQILHNYNEKSKIKEKNRLTYKISGKKLRMKGTEYSEVSMIVQVIFD